NRTVSASSSRVSPVGGGRPSDARQGGVRAVGGGEVAQADHAHGAAAAFDDGEAAHGVLPHEVGRVLGGVVGAERHQGRTGADGADGRLVRIAALGHGPQHDVAVGEDPEEVAVVGHQDVA